MQNMHQTFYRLSLEGMCHLRTRISSANIFTGRPQHEAAEDEHMLDVREAEELLPVVHAGAPHSPVALTYADIPRTSHLGFPSQCEMPHSRWWRLAQKAASTANITPRTTKAT